MTFSVCLISLIVTLSSCSVAQMCPTLCNPMDYSTPGFLVLHYLLELAQTRVHWISDAIQPSCPLSSPSLSAFSLFQGVSTSHQVKRQSIGASASASFFPMNIQGPFSLGLTGLISLQSKGLSRNFSNATVWKHQFFSDQASL